jgi:hypothetical protein
MLFTLCGCCIFSIGLYFEVSYLNAFGIDYKILPVPSIYENFPGQRVSVSDHVMLRENEEYLTTSLQKLHVDYMFIIF